jgi:predicted lipoprotein with Yx(FWY)xxD motif
MRAFLIFAAFAVSALVLAPGALSSSSRAPAAVTARGSDYGRILFDGRGFALYAFTRDQTGHSACSQACAKEWPPFIVRRLPRAGRGVAASLLGAIRRSDGRLQATYAGKALYFYTGDRKAGQVWCQNVREFGGLWLVVRPNGRLVR